MEVHDTRLGTRRSAWILLRPRRWHPSSRRVTSTTSSPATTPTPTATHRHTRRGPDEPQPLLAVAIDYLFSHREGWPTDAAIGKTLVSSMIIDRVAASLGKTLLEVPVGFKWFVPGLLDWLGRLRRRGIRWSVVPAQGRLRVDDRQRRHTCCVCSRRDPRRPRARRPRSATPSSRPSSGSSAYQRVDAAATPLRESALSKLSRMPSRPPNSRARRSPRSCRTRRATGRDRRPEGADRVGMVRRPSLGHRRRVQAVRRVAARRGSTCARFRKRRARSCRPPSARPDVSFQAASPSGAAPLPRAPGRAGQRHAALVLVPRNGIRAKKLTKRVPPAGGVFSPSRIRLHDRRRRSRLTTGGGRAG